MPINKNHEFEELDGVKCAIVEKNVSGLRTAFLRTLLEGNGYSVVTVPTPPPKATAPPKPPAGSEEVIEPNDPESAGPPTPETFTVGVTDVTFNSTNAVFGRLLRTPDGHVVTLAYWQQQEDVPGDEIPYFDFKREEPHSGG